MYNQFPYSNFNPGVFNVMQTSPTSNGLGRLFGGLSKKSFNWDSFLNNAQRTLNVINQAMPIYNQVRPVFKNMGTIFKVLGELNSTPSITSAASTSASTIGTASSASSVPQFFA